MCKISKVKTFKGEISNANVEINMSRYSKSSKDSRNKFKFLQDNDYHNIYVKFRISVIRNTY